MNSCDVCFALSFKTFCSHHAKWIENVSTSIEHFIFYIFEILKAVCTSSKYFWLEMKLYRGYLDSKYTRMAAIFLLKVWFPWTNNVHVTLTQKSNTSQRQDMRPKIYIPKFAKYVVMLRSFALMIFASIFASILKIDFLFFQKTCEFSVLPMEIGDLKACRTEIFSVLARYLSSSKFSIE